MFLHSAYSFYNIYWLNKSVQLLIRIELKRQFANKTKSLVEIILLAKLVQTPTNAHFVDKNEVRF